MTPLDLLAPDQRAVLELVLRQDRSYGELSELLGIPEREVRDRAEAALRALAGTPDDEVDTGRIADWLLGQQTARAAASTRTQLERSEPSRAWAALAAGRLREVGGERVPAVPEAGDEPRGAAPPAAARGATSAPRPRPRPLRDGGAPVAAAPAAAPAAPATRAAPPRSSLLGGALIIGAVALVVAAVLVFVLTRSSGNSSSSSPPVAGTTPTPTATASLGATANDIVLTGAKGTSAAGLMRLFKSQGGGVQFAIGAQGLPNNAKGEFYAVWFTKKGGGAKLLGFPQTQVTNGTLTVGGPGKADQKDFPRLFATYDHVLIARETTAKPTHPGPILLEGTLPHGQAGG